MGKVAGSKVMNDVAKLLAPWQLGTMRVQKQYYIPPDFTWNSYTLRGSKLMNDVAKLLAPQQLGTMGVQKPYYIPPAFTWTSYTLRVLIKLAFMNSFHKVCSDKMLDAVQLPHLVYIHPFVQSVYSSPSSLF